MKRYRVLEKEGRFYPQEHKPDLKRNDDDWVLILETKNFCFMRGLETVSYIVSFETLDEATEYIDKKIEDDRKQRVPIKIHEYVEKN